MNFNGDFNMRIFSYLLFLSLLFISCDNTSSNFEEKEYNYSLITNPTDTTNSCDYLIITPDELFETAKELATYRNNNVNDDVDDAKILKLSDIYWYIGEISINTIKTSIMWPVYRWEIYPEYIVLLGRSELDDKNNDAIPFVTDTAISKYGDNHYIDLIKGGEQIYNLSLGRIPIRNNQEGYNYVQKLKKYESTSIKKILSVADDNWVDNHYDAIIHSNSALKLLDSTNNSFEKDTFLLSSFTSDTSMKGQPLTENEIKIAKNSLFKKINSKNQIITFNGHSNYATWTDEAILDGKDVSDISKIKSTSLFLVNGSIYTDHSSSLPYQLISSNSSGAVGYIGTVSTAYVTSGTVFCSSLLKEYTLNEKISIGKALSRTIKETENQSFVLFGDPAIMLN